MSRQTLEKLAKQMGIACHFTNAEGNDQAVADETLEALLAAMKTPCLDTPQPVPQVKVFTQNQPYILPCLEISDYRWALVLEEQPAVVAFHGEVEQMNSLTLPGQLPLGYHTLQIYQGDRVYHCRVIIAPERCYQPEALLGGAKLWGACIQLYTLRSETNWGIGDFGDLKHFINELALRGGAFVGLNPIHSLYPAVPENASPYSPSSRRWLNIAYIDVSQVSAFQQSAAAQRWWQKEEVQQQLHELRAAKYVNYQGVIELKLTALRQAFTHFLESSERDNDRFADFVAEGGTSLYQQATFDAIQQQRVTQDALTEGWPHWPIHLQDPQSQGVIDFCATYSQEVKFYLWLQWLAHEQFTSCYVETQRRGMAIGLYRDLAVGVAQDGAETWGERKYYCLQASIGAPPDALGPLGQNWQLPPMSPLIMVQQAYQPFIDLLQANMTACGALRIDHVMSLLRLWWIPDGQGAKHGAYVYYPVDDLLAILALESQRHGCMIIGEDLGIVPQEIVAKLKQSAVYSYKVMYFEQDRHLQDYPAQAMATITTHDLPTLAGYWQSDDIQRGAELNLYPDPALRKKLIDEREQSKQHWLDTLQQNCGFTPDRDDRQNIDQALSHQLQGMLADCNSALLGSQPEDWLGMTDPVNIPGTVDEYPNWRRKLSVDLETIFADPEINQLFKDFNRRRAGARNP